MATHLWEVDRQLKPTVFDWVRAKHATARGIYFRGSPDSHIGALSDHKGRKR